MRQIYTSPRPENIDRVVALLAEHGIEATISNRSAYARSSYRRYRYSARGADSQKWQAVEIERAEDLAPARKLLRDIGIEPLTRHSERLAEARRSHGGRRKSRRAVVNRARVLALAALAAAVAMVMLRSIHLF